MSIIQVQNLSFTYPGALTPVFQNVSLNLDTGWRLGLVGRNGRGKTTFLRLLLGQLQGKGTIQSPDAFEYFPIMPSTQDANALDVAVDIVAPFREWQREMDRLVNEGTPAAMEAYGELEERFSSSGGYTVEESLAAECGRLGIAAEALERPFGTLSGGEQVKLLLAALFQKKHSFLLIDEPTDHLDAEGRETVANWLAGKKGFIVVSHDRAFLDRSVDHILSINRADIELQRGNYSSWRENRTRQDEFEKAENRRLETDIHRLKIASERNKKWSDRIEKTKIGGNNSSYNKGPASLDKGYIGHQAARMMQRSKAIERRQNREIEEKSTLLKNVEEAETLKFPTCKPVKSRLIAGDSLALCFGDRTIFKGLSFTVNEGDRIAVQGANGCGKSSLLHIVEGVLAPTAGSLWKMGSLVISTLPQDTDFLRGSLQAYAEEKGLEQSLFLAILRKLDFEREAFTQPMQTYSAGQKKKVCLAASLSMPAHLFLWDEPLNYVDVLSREQIEAAVLHSRPTMLFVEHDAVFVNNIATGQILL